MKLSLLVLVACFVVSTTIAQEKKDPSFEEVISLHNVSNPEISPDGKSILFTKSGTDWQENRFDTEIWLSKNGAKPIQLTNNPKASSGSPKWSPDGKWIAFISRRGENSQIHAIRFEGGEAIQVSKSEGNIGSFQWSPNGKEIAFLYTDKPKDEKKRKDKYGSYAVEDKEFELTHLRLIDFDPQGAMQWKLPLELNDSTLRAKANGEVLIKSNDFTIEGFLWSPDGSKIAFDHQPDPLINSFFNSDISVYDLKTKEYNVLIENPSYDGIIAWSPDSKSLLYTSSLDNRTSNYYANDQYFIISLGNKKVREIAMDFDENINRLVWNDKAIYGTAWRKTKRHLLSINPKNGKTTLLSTTPERIYDFSMDKSGASISLTGANDNDLTEIYLADITLKSLKKITNNSEQIKDWNTAQSEVVRWKSKDGAEIEGVLHKPQNYDPAKKYPLMVVIHGGPTGISTPGPTPAYVYPIIQWLNKGALVLRPNYRGSAGYGEDFRKLNVNNLGVGDAWDVESGVDHLVAEGVVDESKVASMGWSQGGYISAFLTTNSTKFKAISVGAGISNWMTYYVNTDIHPFTRQYLQSTPWSDKAVYEKTSPMTNINKAQTPTLIQHGEFDKRVPPANAFELYQGLQDVGVETELVIYNGFGHGITKPKERLAAMWHNWQWFGKYIWNEEIELPLK